MVINKAKELYDIDRQTSAANLYMEKLRGMLSGVKISIVGRELQRPWGKLGGPAYGQKGLD